MRNALVSQSALRCDASQAIQVIQQPADGSLDGAGFVTTHAVQETSGDKRVDVGLGYLDLEAAKSSLATFPHSFHADRARATVRDFGKRTGF
jgi:hypothetical protein